jgi:hypothetical protein
MGVPPTHGFASNETIFISFYLQQQKSIEETATDFVDVAIE